MVRNPILRLYFPLVMDYVKMECKESTKILVKEQQAKFSIMS